MNISTKLSTTAALAALLFIGGFALSPSRALAYFPFSENYGSYSTGELAGQGGWTSYGGTPTVGTVSTSCDGFSAKCADMHNASNGVKWIWGSQVAEGDMQIQFEYPSGQTFTGNSGYVMFAFCGSGFNADSVECFSWHQGSNGAGWLALYDNRGNLLFDNISRDAAHTLVFHWDMAVGPMCNFTMALDGSAPATVAITTGTPSNCYNNAFQPSVPLMMNGINFYPSGNGTWHIKFLAINDGATIPYVDTSTHIASTTPVSSAVIASSTTSTFGGGGYVNPSDYVAGHTNFSFCYLKAGAQVGSDIFAPALVVQQGGCLQPDIVLPITASTTFNVSTTTDTSQLIGGYVLKSKIIVPSFTVFGISFGSRTIAATSTVFTIGTTTAADALALGRLAYLEGLNVATSSTAFAGDVCNPISGTFSATYCVLGLFIPTGVQWSQLSDDFTSIISVGPWGFVGTTALILGGHYYTDTTTLPDISFNISDLHSAAALSNTSVDLSPWGVMATGSVFSSATSPKDGKSFRDITETGWDMFVLLMFGLAIFNELVGVGGKAVSND